MHPDLVKDEFDRVESEFGSDSELEFLKGEKTALKKGERILKKKLFENRHVLKLGQEVNLSRIKKHL